MAQTIRSALKNAAEPDLLYFGIANTVIEEKDFLSDSIFSHPRLNYIDIKSKQALGTGKSRMMASMLNERDHKYLLQIDAHNIFEKGWDNILKQNYKDLLKICDKPVISTSPLRWIDGLNKKVFLHAYYGDQVDGKPEDSRYYGIEVDPLDFKTEENFGSLGIKTVTVNVPNSETEIMDYAFIDGIDIKWEDEQKFVEHGFIHAAFMFTDFKFIREIMHDPSNPWDGDQINISFRAGTRGYRMFTIKKCIIWSKDKFNNDKLLSDNDWRYHTGRIQEFDIVNCKLHQSAIFSGEYLGYWGAPDKESIAQYYDKIGIDLSKNFKLDLEKIILPNS